jgi:hypothetical protein
MKHIVRFGLIAWIHPFPLFEEYTSGPHVNTIRRKKVGPQAALECVNTKLQLSHYKVHLGIFRPAITVRRGNPFQLRDT